MNNLYQGKDPRDIGTYSATEVVRYLRMPSSTVRFWVFGAQYNTWQLVLRLYQSDNGSYLPPDISLDSVKPTLKVEQGEIVTILDIDNFSLQQCDFEPDDLVKILWELHNYLDKALKAAVTPDALKFWGAENI